MSSVSLISIAAFLKHQRTMIRTWPRETLVSFLQWYWTQSLMGLIVECGKVSGVALIRIGKRAEIERNGWPEWYAHREFGDTAVVDLACATSTANLQRLWQALLRRAPWCRYVAFKRSKRAPRVRIYKIDHVTRHLLRGGVQ